MKKIWDNQNSEVLYAINEDALHRRIKSKKKQANRIINVTEIGLFVVSILTASILYFDAIVDEEGFWGFAGATVMLFTGLFLLILRWKRQKAENRFDRSMLGELDHAIASTKATITIATNMIWWYFAPIAGFSFIRMIVRGAGIESWLLMITAFTLSFFLVNWERKKCHIPRMQHLLNLKEKLSNDM